MRTYSENEYQDLLAPFLREVFVDPTATVPFSRSYRSRLLFFDLIYEMNGTQFDAFTHALRTTAEPTYFLTYIERTQRDDSDETIVAWSDFSFHYELDVGDRAGYYAAARYPLEQVLYSRSGRWGLQCGGLDFGLIAGEPSFVTTFRDQLPSESWDLSVFAERARAESKDHGEPPWLPDVVKYLAESQPPQVERGQRRRRERG